MGSKLRGSRLEAELERSRTEGNWLRVAELAKAAKSRASGLSSDVVKFVEAEAAVELFLETHDALTPKASYMSDLRGPEEKLRGLLADDDAKDVVALEARLLLAKCAFVRADTRTAQALIEESGMERANTPFRSLRALRLVAEAYAIKGFCMDGTIASSTAPSPTIPGQPRPLTPNGNGIESDSLKKQRTLASFEKAAELTISYVGELEKALNPIRGGLQPPIITTTTATGATGSGSIGASGSLQRPRGTSHEKIGDILEYCLERVAKLRLRESGVERRVAEEGIEWYRRIMTCLGDKSTGERLQMRLSRQFAELLLRAIPDGLEGSGRESKALSTKTQSLGFYSGSHKGYFNPQSKLEEVILLLLLSEALCTKDIVLGRTEEVPPWQLQAISTAKAVYNLLTLIFTSLRQFHSLSSIFERAMKFANEDAFLWHQFALSVACRGSASRALRVLEHSLAISHASLESNRLHEDRDAPQTTTAEHLVTAQLCLEQQSDPEKAVEHASSAMKLAGGGILRGRAMMLKAVALQQCALSSCHQKKMQLLRESGALLEQCVSVDPHDYLALYYAALHYAHVRDLVAARERLARSLELNHEQPAALLLLALIFSAEGDYKAANEVVKAALEDHPTHYGLCVLRLHLFIKIGRVSDSMEASVHLLDLWTSKQAALSGGLNGTDIQGMDSNSSVYRAGSRWGRDTSVYSSPIGGGGSQNGLGADVSDSGVFPSATSEMGASSQPSEHSGLPTMATKGVMTRFKAQASIWVALAELFLGEGRLQEVQPCVEQAVELFPNSSHTHYLKGRLLLAKAQQATSSSSNVLSSTGTSSTDTSSSAAAVSAERLRAEARASFLSALSLYPDHVPTLEHLALLHKQDGNGTMAEHVYRELVRVDPLDGRWWQNLGDCLLAGGRPKDALPCLATAAQLERATPVMPFDAIPLVFPSSVS